MTTEEAATILRNAAWLGTDDERERIEEAVDMAINALTAQPEKRTDKRTETHGCDLISRQAAIRWVKTECNPYGKPTLDFESGKKVIEHLKQMPSAQPEIIQCKECKHWLDIDDGRQKHRMCADVYGDWFCADAERRTDDSD